jgi:SPP1 family predicted phage head-tail adaptor
MLAKDLNIDAGEMRHRVTVTVVTTKTRNAYGEVISTWASPTASDITAPLTVWAKVEQLQGKALEIAHQTGLKSTYRFTFRYCASITEKTLLTWNGQRYTIDSLNNIEGRNIKLVAMASLYTTTG